MYELMIALFFIFFIFTFIKIFNKTYILGFVYFLLFIYTFFTMIGYIYFPEKLALVSMGQYYGLDFFLKYFIYIFLGFISIYLFYNIIYKFSKISFKIRLKIEETSRMKNINIFIFRIISISWILITLYYLLNNYSQLSYYNQHILKSNKIWFYLYSSNILILFSSIVKLKYDKSAISKSITIFSIIINFVLFLLTAIRAGQRIQIFSLFLSFLIVLIIKKQLKIIPRNFIKFLKLIIIIICFIVISQIIRNTRGRISSLHEIQIEHISISSLFNLEGIVFQDYLSPSLTLMTSMYYKLIFPLEIIKSNILNSLIIFDYPTAGEVISRLLDPNGWGGVGYYYFTEGYNLLGFGGFIYSALVIVLNYYIYENLFTKTNDEIYNLLISGVISYYMINIVRGGTLFMIKGILFYIIPFTILYCIAANKKLVLVFNRISN